MNHYLLSAKDLIDWLNTLARENQVLVPVKEDNGYTFAGWDGENLPDSDYQNTLKPPKDLFFPQYQVLLKYQKVKGERPFIASPDLQEDRRVIFGIRPCDAQSLELLDKVFIGEDYQDPYYQAARANTLVVSLGCQTPGRACFCTDPLSTNGADILMAPEGGNYLVEIVTQKGEEAFKNASRKESDTKTLEKVKEINQAREEIATADFMEKLGTIFDSPVWYENQQKCIKCGVCSFLCPTCHCFDITDDKQGNKVRSWDSCMFSSFTKQASGHNPRPTGTERIRQRVMHKFHYFPQRYGVFACVGCGRCVEKCPVNLDIRQVIKTLKGVS